MKQHHFQMVYSPYSEMLIDVPSSGYENENWVSSSQDEGDYAWAQGRGYIHGSIEDVWEKLRLPEVFINHEEVVEYDITDVVPPDYDYHFIVHNRSENIVNVEFENEWRHGSLENRDGNVERVGVRWQKNFRNGVYSIFGRVDSNSCH